jgi:hypothetical protein
MISLTSSLASSIPATSSNVTRTFSWATNLARLRPKARTLPGPPVARICRTKSHHARTIRMIQGTAPMRNACQKLGPLLWIFEASAIPPTSRSNPPCSWR